MMMCWEPNDDGGGAVLCAEHPARLRVRSFAVVVIQPPHRRRCLPLQVGGAQTCDDQSVLSRYLRLPPVCFIAVPARTRNSYWPSR